VAAACKINEIPAGRPSTEGSIFRPAGMTSRGTFARAALSSWSVRSGRYRIAFRAGPERPPQAPRAHYRLLMSRPPEIMATARDAKARR
jgi:hypothetical protein